MTAPYPDDLLWDKICELEWAPHFAAGNVLKYIRYEEGGFVQAVLYWRRLVTFMRQTTATHRQYLIIRHAYARLIAELTDDEYNRLTETA